MKTPTKTALLVIDMQESFRAPGMGWKETANPDVIDNVKKLVASSRLLGDLIVWITHASPGSSSPFNPRLGLVKLMAELDPSPTEVTITKTSINSFTSTDLEKILRERGVQNLVICGIRTDQCCETTARIGSDLGFDITFITEATSTNPVVAVDGSGIISGKEIMRHTESVLKARGFATISTLEQYFAARG